MARLLLHGGHVYSPADPFATALIVDGTRVAAVGQDAPLLLEADGVDEVIDLRGASVTPAFVDAHVHATATGLLLTGVDLAGTAGPQDLLTLLSARLAAGEGPLLGHGWDDSQWLGAPWRSGSWQGTAADWEALQQDIDALAGDRQIYLSRIDVHSALVSVALKARVGLAHAPSGPLRREDHHAVRRAALGDLGASTRIDAIRAMLRRAAALGIATVHECGGPDIGGYEDFRLVLEAGSDPGLPGVIGYWGEIGADGVAVARQLGARGAAGDLFVDGSIGSRTACLRHPYLDDTASHGTQYLDAAQIAEHLRLCVDAGMQAGFHVIGDAAMDAVVAGLRQVAQESGTAAMHGARHRIEHAEMVDDDHIAALAQFGVTASMQPMFDALWGGSDGMYAQRLGERHAQMNPFAALMRAGVTLAFGSDAPVTPLGPWEAVRAAAFHHQHEARISARAAFLAHTRGGHRAAGNDRDGVLVPGAVADLAIWEPSELVVQAPDSRVAAWSTDPRAATPGLPDLTPGVPAPQCHRTMRAGVPIHDDGWLAG